MTPPARRTPALRQLDATVLKPEVLAWVSELRLVWAAAELSINQFVHRYGGGAIDKSTVSRYLSGQRVPGGRWFLERLQAACDDAGSVLLPEVIEHLQSLQLGALETAHPLDYKVRIVRDELEIAVTTLRETERYARDVEQQLTERQQQIHDLTAENHQLRTAWDDDRDRLLAEITELSSRLQHAQRRRDEAEQRCRRLEGLLDTLDAGPDSEDENSVSVSSLIQAFAQVETRALTRLLSELGNQENTVYQGMDSQWLVSLASAAQSSIDAISPHSLEVDSVNFQLNNQFWTTDLSRRYLAAQREAIKRGVRVRRIFIFNTNEQIGDATFQQHCAVQENLGIEVRVLASEELSADSSGLDLVLFDNTVSHETVPTPDPTDWLFTTHLIQSEEHLRARTQQFNTIWAASTPLNGRTLPPPTQDVPPSAEQM